ncbi:MAG: DUF4835 family protein [Marinilabiliaceae bacterium]|nr:DUF4835 family protein [Marinilabiliaceae bacterium]
MIRRIVFILFLSLFACVGNSQELQCSISFQSASVQGTNKQIYENMRNSINEFMRNQRWTTDKFATIERIECSLNFNITEQISSNEFKGTLTVQLRRPVWGTAYTTTMLNLQDNNIQFRYNEGQPVTFNETSYDQDNLMPIIAFYVYFMLGMDYDSFSQDGGTEYFKKAEQIVNQAQVSSFSGWKSYEDTKNRYWLINNVLDDNHRTFRTQVYNYHRLGLDQMSESVDKGRTAILDCIDRLRKVKQNSSRNAYLLGLFFTAKSDEIVSLFSQSPDIEKTKVIEFLTVADPGNLSKYQKIKTNK